MKTHSAILCCSLWLLLVMLFTAGTVVNAASVEELHTVTFKISPYGGFAILQKESGLPETSSRMDQLQKLFADAGISPPLTNLLLFKSGALVARGTDEQLNLIAKVVAHLNGKDPSIGHNPPDQKSPVEKQGGESRRDAVSALERNQATIEASRSAILEKLNNLRLDSLSDGEWQLGDLLHMLNVESRKVDPDRKGINFIVSNYSNGSEIDLNTWPNGQPMSQTNLADMTVTIGPGLQDTRLIDALDAIVKGADTRISHRIESYAVVFSLALEKRVGLFTRVLKLDPFTFFQGLESVTSSTFAGISGGGRGGGVDGGFAGGGTGNGLQFVSTRTSVATVSNEVLSLFDTMGVNLSPPKSLFFNDRTGILLVRATPEDLETMEAVVLALNERPPLVNIKTRFVEFPETLAEQLLKEYFVTYAESTPSSGSNLLFTTVLDVEQTKDFIRKSRQISGGNIFNTAEVTTQSGYEAQICSIDINMIATGEPIVWPYPTFWINLIPTLGSGGFTMDLNLTLRYTTDKTIFPPTDIPSDRFLVSKPISLSEVWDGQTIVLTTLERDTDADKSINNDSTDKSSVVAKKYLFVLITPTLIDPFGNRIYTDEDVSSEQNRFNAQRK